MIANVTLNFKHVKSEGSIQLREAGVHICQSPGHRTGDCHLIKSLSSSLSIAQLIVLCCLDSSPALSNKNGTFVNQLVPRGREVVVCKYLKTFFTTIQTIRDLIELSIYSQSGSHEALIEQSVYSCINNSRKVYTSSWAGRANARTVH